MEDLATEDSMIQVSPATWEVEEEEEEVMGTPGARGETLTGWVAVQEVV